MKSVRWRAAKAGFLCLALRIIPCFLVVLGLVVIALGVLGPAGAQVRKGAPAAKPAEAASGQELKAQLAALATDRDQIKKDLDVLQAQVTQALRLISVLLAAAGLFTVVQGAFGYFSAQNFVTQAKDSLNEIKGRASEVQRRFPMFSEAERVRREAYDLLARSFERSDTWTAGENLYDRTDLMARQQILSLEHFIGLEFLETGERQEDVARHFRNLGVFYGHKYVSEKKQARADFDRAEYYLRLALEKTRRGFHILNDLGLLYSEFRQPTDPAKAEKYFEESRRVNGNQQRALYNLANIAHDRGEYERARRLLEEAKTKPTWELTPRPETKGEIHYNLACALSRLAETAAAPARLMGEACRELESAARIGATKREFVTKDLEPGEDLCFLKSQPAFAVLVKNALEIFEQAWAQQR